MNASLINSSTDCIYHARLSGMSDMRETPRDHIRPFCKMLDGEPC
jgi:hypothetical protein